MRNTFVQTLLEIAEKDKRLVLLTGDLGYSVLEPFAEKFPKRFFNAGVAEQNMIGMAAGLAEAGMIPFVYSIATFASMRGYEFFRNTAVAQRLPVRIIGVGGGFEYGHNGLSHYALEDIALMRAQIGAHVFAPADNDQCRECLHKTWDLPEPVYYRISKDSRKIPDLHGQFSVGKPNLIGSGADILLVTSGAISATVVQAANIMKKTGTQIAVMIVSTLSAKARSSWLAKHLAEFSVVITVESHYTVGGLGSMISDAIAEHGLGCRLVKRAISDIPKASVGSQEYLHKIHGLSAEHIIQTVRRELSQIKR